MIKVLVQHDKIYKNMSKTNPFLNVCKKIKFLISVALIADTNRYLTILDKNKNKNYSVKKFNST